MKWFEKIIQIHREVAGNAVHHGFTIDKSGRYFIWEEDGAEDFLSDNTHTERAVTGTTDLFTNIEFDPWQKEFENRLNADTAISWELTDTDFEPETGLWHYTWDWSVSDGEVFSN